MIVSSTSRANFRHSCVRVKHAGVAVHQNRKFTFSEWFLNEHYDGSMEKFGLAYSRVRFWSKENLAELVDGPAVFRRCQGWMVLCYFVCHSVITSAKNFTCQI